MKNLRNVIVMSAFMLVFFCYGAEDCYLRGYATLKRVGIKNVTRSQTEDVVSFITAIGPHNGIFVATRYLRGKDKGKKECVLKEEGCETRFCPRRSQYYFDIAVAQYKKEQEEREKSKKSLTKEQT